MPVSVPFKLVAPDAENLVKLHILEAPAAGGPYVEIDVVTPIGSYPEYIDHYTTQNATSATDWFAVQWEDDKGALSDISAGVQGGTTTLVGEILDRVQQRDPSLSENIAKQEVEATVESYFNVDPYTLIPADIEAGKVYRTLNGLTYLALARSYIASKVQGSDIQAATMGLISIRNQTNTRAGQNQKDIESLIDMANKELGISASYVMLMEDIEAVTYPTYDHSRLVSGYITIDA